MSTTSTTKINQEGIFRVFFQQIEDKISKLKSDVLKSKMKGKDIDIELRIDDIRQCDLDMNNKRIIVNEMFFDPPSFFHVVFSISISAKNYPDVLEAYGYTARYFKDDRAIELGDYNWHTNIIAPIPVTQAFYSPIISEAMPNMSVNIEKNPTFRLYYEIRLGLNSTNSSTFVRTKEAATVRGKVLK